MNYASFPVFLLSLCLAQAFAATYSEDVQDALKQLQVSKNILSDFDLKTLPHFEGNPKEQSYLPSQKGELEQKGKQFLTQNEEGQYIGALADANKEIMLDQENKDKGRNDLETPLSDEIACQDGACIATHAQLSNDFSEGAVQMGALNGVAEDVRDKQVPQEVAAIFKAADITCRVVYKENRFNFCKQNHDNWGASQSEKELHKAQREGRALIAYPGSYCSQFKKILGHKTCTQKRQSWCVFQSKLAKMIQVEARRQLGINFGFVGGNVNHADCRGLTPKEVSTIQFDTPQMQQALNELAEVFESKKRLPEQNQVTSRAQVQVKIQQGGFYE